MAADGSITHWVRLLQQGQHEAAQPLWESYFSRLVSLAQKKLGGRSLGIADAEDVALSAFHSLYRGIERGRFPQIEDRDNLWKLLVVITARKVCHLLRDESTQKRGGPSGSPDHPAQGPVDPAEIIGQEPTPDFAAQVAEETERLLQALSRDDLRQVALLKMEGYTNREIAGQLDCAPRTVDRKLRLIRHTWEQEVKP
jgi:RNA polymerase sigma factor (sigma-70 family)